ncbi:molybdopterin biosynthesis protein [Desulfopila inferna]|uniref:molybdopterin biosynthesis protein n=1 Tax=Desulfopila inferna TaxID=468528 RepID=UPI001963ED3D|nr:molybdopterin biosynthesis protein [Desulfopila inferna]MBM9602627.1 molybdopterin biosynthesis protein [Desulfopila inferna]
MSARNIYLTNKPLSEARELWNAALGRHRFFDNAPTESINVDNSLGRLTAEAVFAGNSSPSYNAAAMDGIAVRFADLASANESNPVILSPEHYQAVNTGNALPPDFDAVVMIEDVNLLSDDRVELISPATPWQHVRTIGEDIVATELILPENHRIRPIDQGAMLATGITEVTVKRSPRILVIPTGTELVQPGQSAEPGQIIEFNSRILAGYLNQWGGEARRSLPVTDEPVLLEEAILAAVKDNDMVVLNAGASAGTKDFTSSVLSKIGEVIVHGIAIKPGKPVILAIVDDVPVIGLPGYPVSALLTMRLFVEEMISGFLGTDMVPREYTAATMSRPVHSSMGVDQMVRVTLGHVGANLMCTPSGKGAGAVMSLVRADGLLTIPAGSEGVGAGEKVQVELLREKSEIEATLVVIGSHDNTIDLLANQLHKHKPRVRISSAHVGSMGGIMAIRRGEAHLAGSHLLDEESGEYNVPFLRRLLPQTPLKLVNLCYREQGFMVPQGNPKKIATFADIAKNQLSFINRQRGAGTRLLTDKILKEQGIDRADINGYAHEEYTHMSIAAAVASGSVDTGMGIRAAALALGLDFVPVAEERYDLIIPEEFYSDFKVLALLDLIRTQSGFHQKILELGGYNLRDCGKILYEQ